MDFLELAGNRYSCRKYKGVKVEDEKIEKILEAARIAPTACNRQPQKIIVVKGDEAMAKLRKCTTSHYNAPLAFIVCYDGNECWVRDYDGKKSGEVDASIVTTHMMLEAYNQGLGSVWVMHFNPESVKKEFELPDNIVAVSILPVGYPADDAEPSPRHLESKTTAEISHTDTLK